MLKETFIFLFERDLRKVIDEIKLYKTGDDLWKIENEIPNSAGNLALHLIGNINHYFGANLGNTGYKRERDLEFSDKNVSREIIAENLEKAIEVLKTTLQNLPEERFEEIYPEEFGGQKQKTFGVIVHLLSHLNYHLGQINYHRRLLSK